MFVQMPPKMSIAEKLAGTRVSHGDYFDAGVDCIVCLPCGGQKIPLQRFSDALHRHVTSRAHTQKITGWQRLNLGTGAFSPQLERQPARCVASQQAPADNHLDNFEFDTASSIRMFRALSGHSVLNPLRGSEIDLDPPTVGEEAELVENFRRAMSVSISICASCGERPLLRDEAFTAKIDVLELLRENEADLTLKHHMTMGDVVYAALKEGVSDDGVTLCHDCNASLGRGVIPPFSLKSGFNYIMLDKLPELTMLERVACSRVVLFCTILKLGGAKTPMAVGSPTIEFSGHVISFPAETRVLAKKLPRGRGEMLKAVGVVFVGTKEELAGVRTIRKYPQLIVRPYRLLEALLFFRAHNPMYSDIEIDEAAIHELDGFGEFLLSAATAASDDARFKDFSATSEVAPDTGRSSCPALEDVFVTSSSQAGRDISMETLQQLRSCFGRRPREPLYHDDCVDEGLRPALFQSFSARQKMSEGLVNDGVSCAFVASLSLLVDIGFGKVVMEDFPNAFEGNWCALHEYAATELCGAAGMEYRDASEFITHYIAERHIPIHAGGDANRDNLRRTEIRVCGDAVVDANVVRESDGSPLHTIIQTTEPINLFAPDTLGELGLRGGIFFDSSREHFIYGYFRSGFFLSEDVLSEGPSMFLLVVCLVYSNFTFDDEIVEARRLEVQNNAPQASNQQAGKEIQRERISVELEPKPLSEYGSFREILFAAFPWIFSGAGFGSFPESPFQQARQKKILSFYDGRFEHPQFAFFLFDVLQRKTVSSGTSMRVRGKKKDVKAFGALMDDVEFQSLLDPAIRNPEGKEARAARLRLLPHLVIGGSKLPFSPMKRRGAMSFLHAETYYRGLPFYYFTLSPPDQDSSLTFWLSDGVSNIGVPLPSLELRTACAKRNPCAAARSFHILVDAVVKELFCLAGTGKSVKKSSSSHRKGILGRSNSLFGVLETQGRMALHIHALIWSLASPGLVSRIASDRALVQRLQKALDNAICSSLPEAFGTPYAKGEAKYRGALSQQRGPAFGTPEFTEHTNMSARSAQIHSPHTFTCWKTGKSHCRLARPQPLKEETGISTIVVSRASAPGFRHLEDFGAIQNDPTAFGKFTVDRVDEVRPIATLGVIAQVDERLLCLETKRPSVWDRSVCEFSSTVLGCTGSNNNIVALGSWRQ